jgi:hypothetical protein
MGGMNLEGVAGLGEEFSAAGRGGGENEHKKIIAGRWKCDETSQRLPNFEMNTLRVLSSTINVIGSLGLES